MTKVLFDILKAAEKAVPLLVAENESLVEMEIVVDLDHHQVVIMHDSMLIAIFEPIGTLRFRLVNPENCTETELGDVHRMVECKLLKKFVNDGPWG